MATRLLYGFLMIAVAQIHFARGGDAPPKGEARSRTLYTSQFYYTSGLLIASNEKGTAAIEVRALHDDGGLDFEYRYLPTGPDAVEVTGKGSVSPVGGNATTQPATVLPEGIAELKVGELPLLWGKGTSVVSHN